MSQDIKPTKLHNDVIKTKSNEPTHQSAYQLTTPISPIAQALPTQPNRLVRSVFTLHFPPKTEISVPPKMCSKQGILVHNLWSFQCWWCYIFDEMLLQDIEPVYLDDLCYTSSQLLRFYFKFLQKYFCLITYLVMLFSWVFKF